MSILTIETPFFDRRRPRCRACQYFGPDPEHNDLTSEKCLSEDAPIRNRTRDHNSKACSRFRLADWLRRPR